jgi:hypothetical protein
VHRLDVGLDATLESSAVAAFVAEPLLGLLTGSCREELCLLIAGGVTVGGVKGYRRREGERE